MQAYGIAQLSWYLYNRYKLKAYNAFNTVLKTKLIRIKYNSLTFLTLKKKCPERLEMNI